MPEPTPDRPSGPEGLSNYYETYWLPEEVRPAAFHRPRLRSPVLPAVDRLFQRYIRSGFRCLDVGCGDGRAGGLGLKPYGVEYLGVDISQNAVEAARARGLDAFQIADSTALPFADAEFDAALCLEVIEHLMYPQLTLAEIFRVLKPGGVLLLTTPNVAYWRRRLDLALLGRWNPFGYSLAVEEPWADPHIRFFNPGSLRRLLTGSGFIRPAVAGHSGMLLGDLPWIGRRIRGEQGSPLYRVFERLAPSLLGCFLNAAAGKPVVP
jgi:SAM-dependent methyltransferase